jgi:hypothetical protein
MPPPIPTAEAQEALTRIAAAVARRDQSEASLAEAVTDARARGATWTEIAKRIGITRQGATERFGGYQR